MNLFENLQLMKESESNEIKTFDISYERNNVYQTILVKAYNEEEAKNFFEKHKPDAKIAGVKIATKDDERPGKPIIDATKESSILKDEKDMEEVVEAKSSSKSNISKMTYKGQKIQNQDWAEYNVGDYVEIINPINNKSLDIKMGISGYGKLVGKVKDTYVYNDGADNLTAGGQNHNYGELNPSADQSCLIEIHDDFKVSQHGSKTNRIIIPIECLKEIDEKYYKDVINKIPRKGFDKLLNKNKKRIESSILKDEKDMEQINENAKLKNMSTKELKRLLKELEQEYNVDSSLSHGMIDRIPGADAYSSQINSIIDELEKRGELNYNDNEYPEELPFDESSILKNEKDMEQIVESVADENSLHYEIIKINNSEIYVRVTEDEDDAEVYNIYINDELYVQESKDEVDKVELLAFECAVNYYIDNNFSDVVDEEDETEESEELTNES